MEESTPVQSGDSGAGSQNDSSQQTNPTPNTSDGADNTADQRVETPDEQGLSSREVDAQQQNEQEPDKQEGNAPEQKSSQEETTAKFDKDLDEWAQKRGYGELKTDLERRLAQDARNQQRDFHKKRSGDLTKESDQIYQPNSEEDDDIAAIRKDQARMQAYVTANTFFDSTPEAKPYEAKMASIVAEERDKRGDQAAAYLLSDLHRLYIIAKNTSSEDDIRDAAEQARHDERQLLAKKQSAATPNANASTHTPAKKADPAEEIRKMSPQEYAQKRASGWNPLSQ